MKKLIPGEVFLNYSVLFSCQYFLIYIYVVLHKISSLHSSLSVGDVFLSILFKQPYVEVFGVKFPRNF